jgi:hypothetical protein
MEMSEPAKRERYQEVVMALMRVSGRKRRDRRRRSQRVRADDLALL